MFIYHWLKKVEKDQWDTLSAHLGTTWKRSELLKIRDKSSNKKAKTPEDLFVPLSLAIRPELVEGLVGKSGGNHGYNEHLPLGDGLNTGMSLPEGVESMSDLDKSEFLNMIKSAGMPISKAS